MTETLQVGQEGGGMPKCRGRCAVTSPLITHRHIVLSQRTQDKVDVALGGLAGYLRRVPHRMESGWTCEPPGVRSATSSYNMNELSARMCQRHLCVG